MKYFSTFFIALVLGFSSAIFLLKSGYVGTPIEIAITVDGGKYVGEVVDGVLQGKGEIHWPDGSYYTGEFKNGLFHGEGVFVDFWDTHFEGQFEQGYFSGGQIVYENDITYEGEIHKWLMQGLGIYHKGKETYKGEFVDNALTGRGEYLVGEDLIYRGTFKNWLYDGKGELFTKEYGRYKGDFKEGSYHGKGEFVADNGDRYRGEYKDNDLVRGTFRSSGGDVYEGEFFYQQYDGEGILTLANGDRYEGGFKYGFYHGEGIMYLNQPQNGVSQYGGSWKRGRLIKSEQRDFIEDYRGVMEQALYSESQLLENALNQISDGDPDKSEAFFLGIAGDGTQRVFNREVTAFQNYFGSTLSLERRQITLINDRTLIAQHPMATTTSIERAIQTLSERMNTEQDLLVLYISSHGSSVHEISLKNVAINLTNLPADTLATTLKNSGIKWKLIFISACYSGGYINSLKDDHTLIMTASAANKKSFGCSDDAEITEFGKALLNNLPKATDLEEVYKLTAEIIEQNEDEGGKTNSDPQLYVGKNIQEKLREFNRFH